MTAAQAADATILIVGIDQVRVVIAASFLLHRWPALGRWSGGACLFGPALFMVVMFGGGGGVVVGGVVAGWVAGWLAGWWWCSPRTLVQSVESEGHDRYNITLPGFQNQLISEVAAASKGPVIVVVMSGGAVDVSTPKATSSVHGLLWVGYPGQSGGQAIADILFGTVSPGASPGGPA